MRCAIILHASRGEGKTTPAITAAEQAKTDGLKVMGILSKRVLDGGDYPSYALLDLSTNEVTPLVKPSNKSPGDGWESHGNPHFVFSKKGFYTANLALYRAAGEMKNGVVVFVDEYGRLECQGKGIYLGAVKVAEALRLGGIAIFLCRDDIVQEVVALIREKSVRVFTLEAGDPEALLRIIRGCSKL